MSQRNRSSGWKFAKITGHMNEDELADQLRNDRIFARKTGERIFGTDQGDIVEVEAGGISAVKVPSVLGGTTTGKTDLVAIWPTGKTARISLKKSLEGQAYLIGVDRFCQGYEKQYGIKVPDEVATFLSLFVGGDFNILEDFLRGRPRIGPSLPRHHGELLEIHQNRLTLATINEYAPELVTSTVDWMSQSLENLCDFILSKGLASQTIDHATTIWYWSPLKKIDEMYSINRCKLASPESEQLYFGSQNGGTVLYLPFGPVQMHQNQLQFRHRRQDISKLNAQPSS